MEIVPDTRYDLVTANINRRVLLELMMDLRSRLAPGGSLLLSGVLQAQRNSVLDAAERHGLHLDTDATEDGWWAARFTPT
jgi:ribosomal protein L11 methyltransferase